MSQVASEGASLLASAPSCKHCGGSATDDRHVNGECKGRNIELFREQERLRARVSTLEGSLVVVYRHIEFLRDRSRRPWWKVWGK